MNRFGHDLTVYGEENKNKSGQKIFSAQISLNASMYS
jgi:hypothetical protein